jgi:hypothetical protein
MRLPRVARFAVLALSTLVVMAPAAFVLADQYRLTSGGLVVHHHTSAYTVYYGFTGGWKDEGENSRAEWNADLDRLSGGAHITLPRVDAPSDSVGADSQPEIEVEKQALGDSGALITWQAPYHDASSAVTINSSKTVSSDEKRGRMCKIFGNIMGLAAAGTGRNDCMEDPTVYRYVLDESVGLVNDFYGPNVSIDSPLTSRKDDVKTTGSYDVSATASGHATKSVTIRLDGNVIASNSQTPCGEECSATTSPSAPVDGLSAGTHSLSATARNEFDQTTTKAITLTVSAPAPDWGFADDWPNLTSEIPNTGQGSPTSLGATTNRLIVRWRQAEPNAPVGGVHTYDWSSFTPAYNAMLSAGQKPVLTLDAAPPWARVSGFPSCTYTNGCDYPSAPAHDPDWREFVHQAILRFPQVVAIEVWNEPNFDRFWFPNANAERYAEVLHSARLGASDAGTTRPVITGGLSPGAGSTEKIAQATFLTNVYALGGAADFTGIGEHVYVKGAVDQDDWVRGEGITIDELRTVRDSPAVNDQPSRIWVTEVGVSTSPNTPSVHDANAVVQSDQGPTLAAMYKGVGSDVKVFLIFRYHDTADDGVSDYFGHMGVVRNTTLAPKPAFADLGCELGGRGC